MRLLPGVVAGIVAASRPLARPILTVNLGDYWPFSTAFRRIASGGTPAPPRVAAHTVYLTDAALQIIADAKAEINRLSRRRDEPWNGCLFEARPGSPITNAALCRAVDRQHVALGAKVVQPWGRWTPHDLRRTMRAGLSACRVRPDIAEMTIGHVKSGIIAVYDHHSFDAERQAAWEAWDARLSRIVAGQDPDAAQANNVVRLRVAK